MSKFINPQKWKGIAIIEGHGNELDPDVRKLDPEVISERCRAMWDTKVSSKPFPNTSVALSVQSIGISLA